MSYADVDGLKNYSVKFTKALAARDYSTAYSMASQELRNKISQKQMQDDFESIVPSDWAFWGPDGEPVAAADPVLQWPDKQPSEVGIVYVSIGGHEYSEAVSVKIESVDGALRVRDIEYGRP